MQTVIKFKYALVFAIISITANLASGQYAERQSQWKNRDQESGTEVTINGNPVSGDWQSSYGSRTRDQDSGLDEYFPRFLPYEGGEPWREIYPWRAPEYHESQSRDTESGSESGHCRTKQYVEPRFGISMTATVCTHTHSHRETSVGSSYYERP